MAFGNMFTSIGTALGTRITMAFVHIMAAIGSIAGRCMHSLGNEWLDRESREIKRWLDEANELFTFLFLSFLVFLDDRFLCFV